MRACRQQQRTLGLLIALCLLHVVSCGSEEDGEGPLSEHSQALNACDEVVPANRNIDGFPAYAQCPAFEAGPIYSNNGIDTSATKVAADWQMTQPVGGYQCTELAHRYWMFKFKVNWIPRGNAGTWCDTQPPATSGVVQSTTPMHGDLMVLAPGSCGAAASTGHVTVVDTIDTGSGRLTVVEQNGARRGTYQMSCAKCFLHIVANAGAGDAGVTPMIDAGLVAPRDAGQSDAGQGVDAAARDAGASTPGPVSSDAGVTPPSPSSASVGQDAQAQRSDAGTSSVTSPSLPTSPEPSEADDGEGGCALAGQGHARGLSPFTLLLLALVLRRRRQA